MARTLTADQLGQLIQLVEKEDKTAEEAATVIGVKPGSIRNLLKESGYRIRLKRVVEPITAIPIPANLSA